MFLCNSPLLFLPLPFLSLVIFLRMLLLIRIELSVFLLFVVVLHPLIASILPTSWMFSTIPFFVANNFDVLHVDIFELS